MTSVPAARPALIPYQLPAITRPLATTVVVAIALLLVSRRLAGALVTPLDGPMLLAVGVLVTGLTFIARRHPLSARNRATDVVLSAALVAIVLAVAIPGTSAVALAALITMAVLEEGLAWSTRTKKIALPASTAIQEPDEQITQRLTRLRTAEGDDVLRAHLLAVFDNGQRTATIHVAFCPPFASLPKIEFEQTSGPQARIAQGQLLPQGVRLDLKLAFPGPATVELDLSATSPQLTQQR